MASRKRLLAICSVFLLASAAILTAGLGYIADQERILKKEKLDQIRTISQYKVKQIEAWRSDFLNYASTISSGSFIVKHLEELLDVPRSDQARDRILRWMEAARRRFHFRKVTLFDADLNPRSSIPPGPPAMDVGRESHLRESMAEKRVSLSDLHRGDGPDEIHFDLSVPLTHEDDPDRKVRGVVLIQIDPLDALYPLIRSWPTASGSAESLLVRREGGRVRFLSPLRHGESTVLGFSLPLTDPTIVAVMATSGKDGTVEGRDYRGAQVIAAIGRIRDTDWLLISKVDRSEVYGPIERQGYLAGIIILLLIGSSGLALWQIWRRQQGRQQEKMMAELEHQRKILNEILFSTPDLMLLIDPEGVILYASQAWMKTMGMEEEEVMGRTWQDLDFAAPTRDRLQGQLDSVFTSGRPVVDESILNTFGGARQFEYIMSPVHGQDGSVDMVVVTARDINERKKNMEVLRESQESLELAIKASGIGLWEWDVRTGETYFSPRWKEQIGYQDHEIPNLFTEWESRIHPKDRERTIEALRAHLVDPTHDYEVEFRLQHQDSSYRWILARGKVSVDAEGRPEKLMGCHIDITERKDLEIQLRQAQKLESIGQLAAGIAHEINTPIQYIGDNATFLQGAFRDLVGVLEAYEGGRREAAGGAAHLAEIESAIGKADLDYLRVEVPRSIEQTLEGVARVANIVRAMKDFSHPGGEVKIPSDLNRMIESTLTVSRNEWKYVAEVETDLDPSLPPVTCLPGEINQVLLNLIVNAAHAIGDVVKERGGKGRIRVSTRRAGDRAEVRVSDTGTGIPEAIRSKVFDPFFTTKPVGKGTGQGLSIAYNVTVKRHGGAIDFQTEVGEGTTFIVSLPFEPAAPAAGEVREEAGRALETCSIKEGE